MRRDRFSWVGAALLAACASPPSASDGGADAPDSTAQDSGLAARCQGLLDQQRACRPLTECERRTGIGFCVSYREELVASFEACYARDGCDGGGGCARPTLGPTRAFAGALRALCTACPGFDGEPGPTLESCVQSPRTAASLLNTIKLFNDAVVERMTPCLARLPPDPLACMSGVETCLLQAVPEYAAFKACTRRP